MGLLSLFVMFSQSHLMGASSASHSSDRWTSCQTIKIDKGASGSLAPKHSLGTIATKLVVEAEWGNCIKGGCKLTHLNRAADKVEGRGGGATGAFALGPRWGPPLVLHYQKIDRNSRTVTLVQQSGRYSVNNYSGINCWNVLTFNLRGPIFLKSFLHSESSYI